MLNTSTTKIYLSNKELLKEIHKSKLTYSWVLDQKYAEYDVIVPTLDDINHKPTDKFPDGAIAHAKQRKADKRTAELWEKGVISWQENGCKGDKPKASQFRVNADSVLESDLVFRIMTYSHIPLDSSRKKTPRSVADRHARVNFAPFQHHAFIDGKLTEVVRSHWSGTPEEGEFTIDKGITTKGLALMYMKLCERYSMRSNWRGYTYIEEMRGQALLQLSQIGLQFDESKSDNPFAYYTTVLTNSFRRIVLTEKKNQIIRDDLLIETGQVPSFTRQLEHEYALVAERERAAALKESEPDEPDEAETLPPSLFE